MSFKIIFFRIISCFKKCVFQGSLKKWIISILVMNRFSYFYYIYFNFILSHVSKTYISKTPHHFSKPMFINGQLLVCVVRKTKNNHFSTAPTWKILKNFVYLFIAYIYLFRCIAIQNKYIKKNWGSPVHLRSSATIERKK